MPNRIKKQSNFFKSGLTYVIILITICVGIILYSLSTQLEPVPNEANTLNHVGSAEKVEVVRAVNVIKIDTDKDIVYFDKPLPDYIPGRTSASSVDMNYYKSSEFKEKGHFKLVRVYTENVNGEIEYDYSFSRDINGSVKNEVQNYDKVSKQDKAE